MPEVLQIPQEAARKRKQARLLRKRADMLEEEAYELVQERAKKFLNKLEDKMLNRTQCLEYLPISTLESLKNWERRYGVYGYLRFDGNSIMRSKLLEFIDMKPLLDRKIRKARS